MDDRIGTKTSNYYFQTSLHRIFFTVFQKRTKFVRQKHRQIAVRPILNNIWYITRLVGLQVCL